MLKTSCTSNGARWKREARLLVQVDKPSVTHIVNYCTENSFPTNTRSSLDSHVTWSVVVKEKTRQDIDPETKPLSAHTFSLPWARGEQCTHTLLPWIRVGNPIRPSYSPFSLSSFFCTPVLPGEAKQANCHKHTHGTDVPPLWPFPSHRVRKAPRNKRRHNWL